MDKLNQTLTADLIQCYAVYLQEQERSAHTIEKYCHILSVLETYFSGQPLTKSALIAWKACLQEKYAAKSVNTMLVAVNGFLRFIGQGSNCSNEQWKAFTPFTDLARNEKTVPTSQCSRR